MGARPKYAAPHAQLAERLAELRARGASFERAWRTAVRSGEPVVMVTATDPPPFAVLWPTDRNDRVAWFGAIVASKEGWRRAYEREPALPRERALAVLSDLLDELGHGAVELAA